LNQQIRFCRSFDGTRIAYAITGGGTPLVKAPHWLTHLEYEMESPVWKPWIEALSRSYAFLRMDERGCGLSDWDVGDISQESWVRDLEAVVDAAGLERFALFGHSQGAGISIEYAVRHPERVTHLVILGGYSRGWFKRGLPAERIEELEAQLKLVEAGWGRDEATYRQMFAMSFIPGATMEQVNSLSEMQRRSASPQNAVRILRAFFNIDVQERAPQVACPTVILHGRNDRRAPFEQGRNLASLIPGARFVPLDTENHVLLSHEPAFTRFFEELHAFLPSGTRPVATFSGLTAREAEILERIAQGLDNAQIAAPLGLSEKTVRNHITRVFDKIGVENRSQAIVLARERGMGQQSRLS
jgi:pimeloyl-ACP methyl ester carboxylesterase/DNA-binding CsgD family transcriptional regulator